MLGFDALGRLALGQGSDQAALTNVLVAATGSYAITGSLVSLRSVAPAGSNPYTISGNAAFGISSLTGGAGSYVIGGSAALFAGRMPAAVGGYAVSGQAAGGKSNFAAAGDSYSITGQPSALTPTVSAVAGAYTIIGGSSLLPAAMRAAGGGYVLALGDYGLRRGGGDYDQVYGGIGHYLEELERARQLARITRKTPAPIVQPPIPRLQPLAAPPVGVPAQATDLRAALGQRMAAQQAARQQAELVKRRRQAVEILLLAS